MQRRILLLVLTISLLIVMAGCAEPEPEIVEVTRQVKVPQTVEVTQEVTKLVEQIVTRPVEVTRIVTAEPTARPTTASATSEFAANYIGAQEQGGVQIELSRVACMTRSKYKDWSGLSEEELANWLGDPRTVCEFILTVQNTTGEVRRVYPDQGTVVIGSEQIDLVAQSARISNSEDVSGELQPGVVRIGGFWFGVRRSEIDEIDEMTYIIDAPSDEDYSTRDAEFRFEFSTEGWGFEPLPEDL